MSERTIRTDLAKKNQEREKIKLLACPFCGGIAEFTEVELNSGTREDAVECLDCAAMTCSAETLEMAASYWNMRVR